MGVSTYAQDIKITNAYLEHNVIVDNQKCMVIHVTMDAEGYNGKEGWIIAYLEKPKGTKVKTSISKYQDGDGYFRPYCMWTCSSDSAHWEDITITIPNDYIPNDGTGETFFFDISAFARNDSFVYYYPEYLQFSFGKNEHVHNSENQSIEFYMPCYMCNGTGQFYTYVGYGGFGYKRCPHCLGAGKIRTNFSLSNTPVNSNPPASSGGSSSSTSMQNAYQSAYIKTESLARDAYNWYQREKNSSSSNSLTLTRIAGEYRHFQESLRKTRNEAAKEGVTINQSSWEYKSL